MPTAKQESNLPNTASGRQLWNYWVKGPGLSKWRLSPHPWTTLRNLLLKYMSKREADGLASRMFKAVFGYWPGERKGKNPVGKG